MASRICISALLGCVLVTHGGCAADDTSSDETAIDSLHVELLVDLHLADARAELTGEPAESLRTEILAAHDLDSTDLGALLESYGDQPEKAVALFERAAERLSSEREGR